MNNGTTDGSYDNEAVKIVNALKPFWKKWTEEWGRNCIRSKKMTVSTAPSVITGLIGVTDAFSDTECMIPFQNDVAHASVGDTVWVRWMYDNQQTMYAESMGRIASQPIILSGIVEPVLISSGSNQSFVITFERHFDDVPAIVATMYTTQNEEYGLLSVIVAEVTTTGATVKVVNNATQGKRVGFTWIASGSSSELGSLVVEQNVNTGALTIY